MVLERDFWREELYQSFFMESLIFACALMELEVASRSVVAMRRQVYLFILVIGI